MSTTFLYADVYDSVRIYAAVPNQLCKIAKNARTFQESYSKLQKCALPSRGQTPDIAKLVYGFRESDKITEPFGDVKPSEYKICETDGV